ncbi:hypothetical protein GCM10027610_124170 [Dactylosporangium cerinum]
MPNCEPPKRGQISKIGDRPKTTEALRLLCRSDFAEYGVTGRALDGLRARFAEWRVKLIGNDQS